MVKIKDAPRDTIVTLGRSTKRASEESHAFFRFDSNSVAYVLDLDGAQFGYTDTICAQDECYRDRVSEVGRDAALGTARPGYQSALISIAHLDSGQMHIVRHNLRSEATERVEATIRRYLRNYTVWTFLLWDNDTFERYKWGLLRAVSQDLQTWMDDTIRPKSKRRIMREYYLPFRA